MADDQSRKESDRDKCSEKAQYNPKLDFYSDQFDPLLALQTPGLTVPVPNATTYDNINKYYSAYNAKKQNEETAKKKLIQNQPLPERKWLPHQLPIRVENTFVKRNLFTKMESIEGPMGLLRDCRDKRQRIKVWTRHSHDIRGYCLAYLVAFDKHWNLALEDVEEIWTRTRRRKIPAFDTLLINHRIKLGIAPPPVTILKTTKKTETCSRHVDQLMLRGEQIAFVVVMSDGDKT